MKEIRVAWQIGDACGNGLWHPEPCRKALEEAAERMCLAYGAGTHWVEEREA